MPRFWIALAILAASLSAQPDSPDARNRARAARDLARQGSDSLAWLERLALDADLSVRIEAVKALGEVGTPRSLDPLIRSCGDPDSEMQIRASDGLVNFYLPGYLKNGGLSGKLKRIGTGIQAKFGDATDDSIVPAYVEPRKDVILALGRLVRLGASREVKANAARGVGVLRGRAALDDLYDGLRTKDDLILFESLNAIKKIRDPESGAKITYLVRDLDERVQTTAAETVGMLNYTPAARDLEDVLRRDRTIKVRRATLTGLGLLAQPSSRATFQQYLNDRDEGLRAAAAEGLGRLKNPADLPALEKGFNDERKAFARLSFAFALVKNGRTSLQEFSPFKLLINALASASLSSVAESFLVELAREDAVRGELNRTLPNWGKPEKIGLARVLGVSGDSASGKALEGLVKDADADVSVEATRALRTLKARVP